MNFYFSSDVVLFPLISAVLFQPVKEEGERDCKCVGTVLCLWSRLPPGHTAEMFETLLSLAALCLLSLFLPFLVFQ